MEEMAAPEAEPREPPISRRGLEQPAPVELDFRAL